MTYRESICAGNALIAAEPNHVFVGYGLTHGRAMGTIPPLARIYETPVAESLMCGIAAGVAIAGAFPCVFFERADFIWNAMDVLVNHVDKLDWLSRGTIRCGMIVRVVVGNRIKPLFTGPTHTSDPSHALTLALPRCHVVRLCSDAMNPELIGVAYQLAIEGAKLGRTTILFEYKDLY